MFHLCVRSDRNTTNYYEGSDGGRYVNTRAYDNLDAIKAAAATFAGAFYRVFDADTGAERAMICNGVYLDTTAVFRIEADDNGERITVKDCPTLADVRAAAPFLTGPYYAVRRISPTGNERVGYITDHEFVAIEPITINWKN